MRHTRLSTFARPRSSARPIRTTSVSLAAPRLYTNYSSNSTSQTTRWRRPFVARRRALSLARTYNRLGRLRPTPPAAHDVSWLYRTSLNDARRPWQVFFSPLGSCVSTRLSRRRLAEARLRFSSSRTGRPAALPRVKSDTSAGRCAPPELVARCLWSHEVCPVLVLEPPQLATTSHACGN